MSEKLILIVEDSPTEMHVAKQVCTNNGFAVMTAEDGESAITLAKEHTPDLILLDVILPGQNGFQICRQLKKDPVTQDIKVIMVTSKSQPSDKFWGMKQGADEYVFKPYDEADLVAAMNKQLA